MPMFNHQQYIPEVEENGKCQQNGEQGNCISGLVDEVRVLVILRETRVFVYESMSMSMTIFRASLRPTSARPMLG